ncbi:hypothetical protein CDAR_108391 [Caerostris darwini]|uniref:Uncharacterized protein n=1 Tax=Caerostris darwini TaxID=1538125 RepID=A0AAV4PUZ9_9ARAC|nr:hypothetical protein CDAR_108391 [Caerostris darwini]
MSEARRFRCPSLTVKVSRASSELWTPSSMTHGSQSARRVILGLRLYLPPRKCQLLAFFPKRNFGFGGTSGMHSGCGVTVSYAISFF